MQDLSSVYILTVKSFKVLVLAAVNIPVINVFP